jgi:hypothetical protein
VLDILVQPKREKTAAEQFFKKVMRGTRRAPRQVLTDRLASYAQPVLRSCPMQPLSGKRSKQSSSELTSVNPTQTVPDGTLQVSTPSTAVFVYLQQNRKLVCLDRSFSLSCYSSRNAEPKFGNLGISNSSSSG